MILYGRTISPFVRRVAIWCAMQGRDVEMKPLAATEPQDMEAIRAVHPGRRVPVLQVEDGALLIETFAICDWLDETAPEGTRLVPASGIARRDCMQRIGMANATAEKVVGLVYEKNRRPEEFHWPDWQERLVDQVRSGLAAMEAAAPETGFHGGDTPDGSDIAIVCAYEMAEFSNPWLLESGYPKLAALAARAAEQPGFAASKPGA